MDVGRTNRVLQINDVEFVGLTLHTTLHYLNQSYQKVAGIFVEYSTFYNYQNILIRKVIYIIMQA